MNFKQNKLLTALITIAVGAILIIWKTSVVSIAITALGVYFIVMGILDVVNKKDQTTAIIKIAIGAIAVLLAWLITTVAVIILGVVITLNGIVQILDIVKSNEKQVKLVDKISNKVIEQEVTIRNTMHFEVQKNTRDRKSVV